MRYCQSIAEKVFAQNESKKSEKYGKTKKLKENEEFIMNKIIVKIDGMMCGMCESHINDVIRKTFSVKKVTSSHTKGEAVILAEDPITEDQLRSAIDPTGYQVQSVIVEPYEKKRMFGFGKK
jgi:copper chaperone CopZ